MFPLLSPDAGTVARQVANAPGIVETLSVTPSRTGELFSPQTAFPLPARTSASFGGPVDTRGISLATVGRYAVSQSVAAGTLLDGSVSLAALPYCGPSPVMNTLACYNAFTGELTDEFPLPGTISATPIFFDGSWFLGTSKGFFVRTEGTGLRSTPVIGGRQKVFWGGESLQAMRALRPRTSLDGPEKPDAPSAVYRTGERQGWRWHHTAAAEFVGTPVIQGNMIYALSANQYLYAFELTSGRVAWTARLAAESPLRLMGVSLAATSKEVIVGTDEGVVQGLDPQRGGVLWRHALPLRGQDRFRAIVASPLIVGRSFIVSNAESMTQRVSLDGRAVEWSFPVGSVAQARSDETAVYIGGQDGSVASLESRSGALRWKMAVSRDTPIASVFLVRKHNSLLIANKKGAITLLDAPTGKILAQTAPVGDAVGEFFTGHGESDACLAYSNGGFRCYAVQGTGPRLTAAAVP